MCKAETKTFAEYARPHPRVVDEFVKIGCVMLVCGLMTCGVSFLLATSVTMREICPQYIRTILVMPPVQVGQLVVPQVGLLLIVAGLLRMVSRHRKQKRRSEMPK